MAQAQRSYGAEGERNGPPAPAVLSFADRRRPPKGNPRLATDPPESDRPVSDTELLQHHLTGDPEAFGALVRRYRRELFNFLARFTGDAALAEDVFQETFLQLHVSAATFDPSRRLKPWLFTIAANKARDAMRRGYRRRAAPLDATVAGSSDEATTYAELMPSDIPAPEESLLNLESRQAVQTIIQQMPENLRTVLLLSYFNECPYKEIAEILDVPLGTVKSRLHAAVKYFAKQWKAFAARSGHGGKPSQ
jgi:RNA polymerase sigma-70 factor (ECF subfamily)